MVEEEQVTYVQASTALSFDQGMITCLRKQEGQFAAASSRSDALSLHPGPNNILKNIEEQLMPHKRQYWILKIKL